MERREFTAGMAAVLCVAALPAAAAVMTEKKAAEFDMDLIGPDSMYLESATETVRDNTITIHYVHMMRWRKRPGDEYINIEFAKVGSETYAKWLEERTNPKPYLPHIQFGGAVVAGKGDPEFYNRWLAYASKLT